MAIEKWTQHDEELLAQMQARRERVHQATRKPLQQFIDLSMPTVTEREAVMLVTDWMIANAKFLRDLLEPFDDGVRPPCVNQE